MAASTLPLPPPQVPLMDAGGKPTQQGFEFLDRLQTAVRALMAAISGNLGPPLTLVAVAVPTNANAAAAGIAVGQFYRDTADPAKVYIRTV